MCYPTDQPDRSRIVAAIELAAILAIVAFALCGCRHRPRPLPAIEPAQVATTQAAISNDAIQDDVAEASRLNLVVTGAVHTANKPAAITGLDTQANVLRSATDRLVRQDNELERVVESLTQYHAASTNTIAALTKERDDALSAKAEAETSRDEWKAKYSTQWFAGRFHFWKWTVGLTAGLGVGLWFIAPFAKLLGPIGSVIANIIELVGHALTGFISLILGWIDLAIAWVNRRVEARVKARGK